jgi:hypothetical protein
MISGLLIITAVETCGVDQPMTVLNVEKVACHSASEMLSTTNVIHECRFQSAARDARCSAGGSTPPVVVR